MPRLEVGENRRIYFEYVPGDRSTVLLSHGWGMSCRIWDNTAAVLADMGYGVLTYDHRCCGMSDKDFNDVSIEALGRDVEALCDAVNLDAVVLNGWSLGGAVVVDAASRLGSRVQGLVLTGGATPRYTRNEAFAYGGEVADVEATVAALRADRATFLHGLYFDGVFGQDVGEPVKRWAWQIALQASPCADASLGALADLDQSETLRSLHAPSLVFVGSEDGVVVPDIGRAAAEMLPTSRLVELAGCGHAVFLEDPEAYHRELTAFVGGL